MHPKRKTIKITHFNTNGTSNVQDNQTFLCKSHIISLQDTKLKPSNLKLHLLFPQHTVYNSIPEQGTAIALLVHRTIRHDIVGMDTQHGHNIITIKTTDNTFFPQNTHITSFFAPPNSSKHSHHPFQTDKLKTALNHKHALVTGDLNAHHKHLGCRTNNTHGKHLLTFMQNNNYIIVNDTAQPTFTHVAYNFSDTLDYFIATPALIKYIHTLIHEPDLGSDHIPISILTKATTPARLPTPQNPPPINFRKTDWAKYTQTLKEHMETDTSIWPPQQIATHSELDRQTNLLIKHIQSAMKDSTPVSRPPNPDNPRIPHTTLILINTRRHLKAKQLHHPQEHIRKTINHLNKQIKKNIKAIKKEIEQDKADIIKQGPRHGKFWYTAKQIMKQPTPTQFPIKHNNRILSTPQDKLTAFHEHFQNIFTYTNDPTFNSTFEAHVNTSLPDLSPINITQAQHNDSHPLTKPFTITELYNTLTKTSKNKAPGPDQIRYEHFLKAPTCTHDLMLTFSITFFKQHIYQKLSRHPKSQSYQNQTKISLL